MYYLILIFSALLLGITFAFNKLYQIAYGASPYAAFFFNTLLGLTTLAVFWAIKGFKLELYPYSCIMAGIEGILVISYNIFGFKILKSSGSMSMYTLSLMTGGMVLPYIWGIDFLNEPFTYMRTIGLILITTGVVLSNLKGSKTKWNQALMCGAVFLLNGCVSIVSKMHQIQSIYKTADSSGFVALSGMFKFLIAGTVFLIIKNRNAEQNTLINNKPKAISIIAAAAVASGLSFMLQLKGASELPATVLYPFVTGGSIVFSAVIGGIVFKEKFSLRLILSVALCFIGTIFFI